MDTVESHVGGKAGMVGEEWQMKERKMRKTGRYLKEDEIDWQILEGR